VTGSDGVAAPAGAPPLAAHVPSADTLARTVTPKGDVGSVASVKQVLSAGAEVSGSVAQSLNKRVL
jgi:hypothetical protein